MGSRYYQRRTLRLTLSYSDSIRYRLRVGCHLSSLDYVPSAGFKSGPNVISVGQVGIAFDRDMIVIVDENQFAQKVADKLGLSGVAGSDAHESGSVGTYATAFSATIKNEKDFIEALHSAAFQAVMTPKQTSEG